MCELNRFVSLYLYLNHALKLKNWSLSIKGFSSLKGLKFEERSNQRKPRSPCRVRHQSSDKSVFLFANHQLSSDQNLGF